jgi:hypothetical protein
MRDPTGLRPGVGLPVLPYRNPHSSGWEDPSEARSLRGSNGGRSRHSPDLLLAVGEAWRRPGGYRGDAEQSPYSRLPGMRRVRRE